MKKLLLLTISIFFGLNLFSQKIEDLPRTTTSNATDLIIIDQADATRAIERDNFLAESIDTFYVDFTGGTGSGWYRNADTLRDLITFTYLIDTLENFAEKDTLAYYYLQTQINDTLGYYALITEINDTLSYYFELADVIDTTYNRGFVHKDSTNNFTENNFLSDTLFLTSTDTGYITHSNDTTIIDTKEFLVKYDNVDFLHINSDKSFSIGESTNGDPIFSFSPSNTTYTLRHNSGNYGFLLRANINRLTSSGANVRPFYIADSGGDFMEIPASGTTVLCYRDFNILGGDKLSLIDVSENDTTLIYDDGDTTRIFSNNNPIKIGENSLVITNDSTYTPGNFRADTISADVYEGMTSVSLGSDGQIPSVNSGGTDLEYSANLTWNNDTLTTQNIFAANITDTFTISPNKISHVKQGCCSSDIIYNRNDTKIISIVGYSDQEHTNEIGSYYIDDSGMGITTGHSYISLNDERIFMKNYGTNTDNNLTATIDSANFKIFNINDTLIHNITADSTTRYTSPTFDYQMRETIEPDGKTKYGSFNDVYGEYSYSEYDALNGFYSLNVSDGTTDITFEADAITERFQFYDDVFIDGTVINAVVTITDNDATPDVSGGNILIYDGSANSVTITDFDNPRTGATYTLIGNSDTYTVTINDSGNFKLTGNHILGINDVLILYCLADDNYIELSYSDN